MTTDIDMLGFLQKAEEALAGAASEHANERYNNAANRLYYSCFQAAIAALLRVGVQPPDPRRGWGHDFVQAQFVQQLIRQRKRYPADQADVLMRLFALRRAADYRSDPVSQTQTTRALRLAQAFVATIQGRGGEPR